MSPFPRSGQSVNEDVQLKHLPLQLRYLALRIGEVAPGMTIRPVVSADRTVAPPLSAPLICNMQILQTSCHDHNPMRESANGWGLTSAYYRFCRVGAWPVMRITCEHADGRSHSGISGSPAQPGAHQRCPKDGAQTLRRGTKETR